MASAELAVAIPVLVLVLGLCLASVQYAVAQVRCVDAARTAVRSLARGDSRAVALATGRLGAPTGSLVTAHEGADHVTVTVVAPPGWVGSRLGLPRPRADAVALRESSEPDGS